MHYMLCTFVSFNIYLLSTYHMARKCFKLEWVGMPRLTDNLCLGELVFLMAVGNRL